MDSQQDIGIYLYEMLYGIPYLSSVTDVPLKPKNISSKSYTWIALYITFS
jgi:hypothetical protein